MIPSNGFRIKEVDYVLDKISCSNMTIIGDYSLYIFYINEKNLLKI
jgi:hypothetical protein